MHLTIPSRGRYDIPGKYKNQLRPLTPVTISNIEAERSQKALLAGGHAIIVWGGILAVQYRSLLRGSLLFLRPPHRRACISKYSLWPPQAPVPNLHVQVVWLVRDWQISREVVTMIVKSADLIRPDWSGGEKLGSSS